ncbi:glycosyltransferase family 1 protein [Marivirga sp. S37H4]|uniref:Glycosyltransferase family 1 protein n=1 Tax=Marivirga aurantiaca TaxID=2802615 RepID=A0A934WY49_9BACT|nr:glycosyltransferase [Marivirga aurantiaca]MBK6265313.1 glycosyltransferase family 1 protein [Marivirga aurantiaca]
MANIGIITAPVPGHINPFLLIGKELMNNGHNVTFFNIEDVMEKVLSEGINFHVIAKGLMPRGSVKSLQKRLADLSGTEAMRYWQEDYIKLLKLMLISLPTAIVKEKIDFLLVDQSDGAGGSVADHLGIPYVTLAIGCNMSWEPDLPPVFTPWGYNASEGGRTRNTIAMKKIKENFQPLTDLINYYRERWNLPLFESESEVFPTSDLAQISQMIKEFDFPRKQLAENFLYTGPFRGVMTKSCDFPYEKRNGKPLVYVSLGTIINLKPEIFLEIGNACKDLDVQLVFALGAPLEDHKELQQISGDPIIVPYAPQFEVLSHASLCITHAGLNTVLDALGNGVPLIAVPISFDQPGTAERIKYHHLGKVLNIKYINKELIRETIAEVLEDQNIQARCRDMQQLLSNTTGIKTTVNHIEEIIHKSLKPIQV